MPGCERNLRAACWQRCDHLKADGRDIEGPTGLPPDDALGEVDGPLSIRGGIHWVEARKVAWLNLRGRLACRIDGSLVYRAPLNWYGTDSFTYRARDDRDAYSGTATVTITVNPVNDAPLAMADSAVTERGQSPKKLDDR